MRVVSKTVLLESLASWWELVKPRFEGDFVEVRFVPVKGLVKGSGDYNRFFDELNKVYSECFELFGTPRNKSVSFFVRSLDEVRFLLFGSEFVFFNSKPCYGLNPRQRNGSVLNGTMSCVGFYDVVGFDVDGFDLESARESGVLSDLLCLFEKYGLVGPLVVSSGGGAHFVFRIERSKVSESKKLWFKGFFEEVSVRAELLGVGGVDVLPDVTRVFGLPGSFNVKRGRFVLLESGWSGKVCSGFRVRSKKVLKSDVDFDSVGFVEGLGGVEESLEFLILCKQSVPSGNRHMSLVFALKLLLRDFKCDFKRFERVLRPLYGSIDLNPKSGLSGKSYSKGIVLNWCRDNWSWVCGFDDLVDKVLEYGGKV